MSDLAVIPESTLESQLIGILGEESVITDGAKLELLSGDVYEQGTVAALAITPTDRSQVPAALECIANAGFAIFPRGGGMSYTGGYVPDRASSVVIDTSGLNRIVDVNPDDMTITVEAGVTWSQIYDVLDPMGLRLPFFGTFSGAKATVGGGMSNGALFMGTGRYGTGAEIVLGLEVATTAGRCIRTGQAGFRNGRAYYRSYGPDLTGLFIHDAGALGVKTLITMRLIQKPVVERFASFVFSDVTDTVNALSEIARSGRVEEVYVFDPEATRRGLDTSDLKADIKRLLNVVKKQGGIMRGLKEGAALVGAGRSFVADGVFTLHIVCSGDSQTGVEEDLSACKAIVQRLSGGEIANSMPKTARANPFGPLNGILGSHGDRWAALNSKIAHSDALDVISATDEIFEKYADRMKACRVSYTRLFVGISNHVFSFEPVLRWYDEWLPVHKDTAEPDHLATLTESPPNTAAKELVSEIRKNIVALFAAKGVASTQIGKTYHYYSSLDPDTAELVTDLKRSLDPKGLMNPGALELPAP